MSIISSPIIRCTAQVISCQKTPSGLYSHELLVYFDQPNHTTTIVALHDKMLLRNTTQRLELEWCYLEGHLFYSVLDVYPHEYQQAGPLNPTRYHKYRKDLNI